MGPWEFCVTVGIRFGPPPSLCPVQRSVFETMLGLLAVLGVEETVLMLQCL
jgi:hypothetical protein